MELFVNMSWFNIIPTSSVNRFEICTRKMRFFQCWWKKRKTHMLRWRWNQKKTTAPLESFLRLPALVDTSSGNCGIEELPRIHGLTTNMHSHICIWHGMNISKRLHKSPSNIPRQKGLYGLSTTLAYEMMSTRCVDKQTSGG